MMDFKYITQADKDILSGFCKHHFPHQVRPPVNEIWHYTGSEGLIEILKTGKIYSTQVSCLNDSLEQRYFGDLVHAAIKARRAKETDPSLSVLLRLIDTSLDQRDFAPAGNFVTCFSEVEDDLGQWRGYGGGECGYAIGFKPDAMLEAQKKRRTALLLPLSYDSAKHKLLIDDVVRFGEESFRNGLSRCGSDVEGWARELVVAFATELDIFASLLKHPKFVGENERRIVTWFKSDDLSEMVFRQKRTLLARHIPLDFRAEDGPSAKLPITRIYVGPGPAQRVTQVSVGDLLLKYGYQGIKVERSTAPYRIP